MQIFQKFFYLPLRFSATKLEDSMKNMEATTADIYEKKQIFFLKY